jgi:hypothetical protein
VVQAEQNHRTRVEDGLKGLVVVTPEHQLVPTCPFFLDILEKTSFDSRRRRTGLWSLPACSSNVLSQRRQEQRGRGQALLAVDQQSSRETGGRVARGDVDNRADEMAASRFILGGVQNVTPELFELRPGPAVIPLENGGHELGRNVDDFREWSVNRFHRGLAEVRLREPPGDPDRRSLAWVRGKLGLEGGVGS